MSWIFGSGGAPGSTGLPPGFPPPPGTGGDKGGNTQPGGQPAGSSKMDAYRFDSAALERAAQAAKTLEKSGRLYHILISNLDIEIFYQV